MKIFIKSFIVIIFLYLIICGVFAQEKGDNIKQKLFELTNKDFNASLVKEYSMDDVYKVIESITDIWDINDWAPSFQYLYDYDQNGNNIAVIVKNCVLNPWQNDRRELYSYDQNNLVTLMNAQNWSNNQWIDDYKMIYDYNQQGYNLIVTTQNWINGNWINAGKLFYTYNPEGYTIELLTQQWQNNAWVDMTKIFYTYDPNWNTLEALIQMYVNNAWTDFSRTIYTYNPNGYKITDLTQMKLFNNWTDQLRSTYSYDQNWMVTQCLIENWTNNTWIPSIKYFYTYDVNGNKATQIQQVYQVLSQSWINSSRTTYTYQLITDVTENSQISTEYILYNNYPNPFNPKTIIGYEILNLGERSEKKVQLRVYDMMGREVAELVNQKQSPGYYRVEFNAENLTSGVYVYILKTEKFVEAKKMIIMK